MTQGQLARLTALAIATGTLVAVAATPATAGTTTTVQRLVEATGAGSVLRVEINLPAGIAGLVPQHITQDIVLANGAARTGAVPSALGNAFLGQDGNVSLLQGLLDGKAQTSLEKLTDEYSLLQLPSNPLGLEGGVLHAVSSVGNPNADGLLSSNSSSIASLDLKGAGALDAVLGPVLAVLEEALGSAAGSGSTGGTGSPVEPVTTTVTGVLGTVLDALDEATSGATTPVSDTVQAAVDQVVAAINELLADLTAGQLELSATDSLLDVGLVESTQKITRLGETVTSEVANKLVGIDVLGGLVHVSGIESSAVASLGPAASTADATATLLEAEVGDLLSLAITDQLEALLGGQVGEALPVDLLATLNGALATVTGLLDDALGLQVLQAKTSKSANSEQSSASVESAALVLDPLRNPAAPLVRIGFVPAEAKVVAQSTTSTVVTPEFSPGTQSSLPKTGGPFALTGTLATLLVGAALLARRRRGLIG